MVPKLAVRYVHDSNDLNPIYLAVGGGLSKKRWLAAYRDTIKGQRVVFVRSESQSDDVWIKDRRGIRKVPVEDIMRGV